MVGDEGHEIAKLSANNEDIPSTWSPATPPSPFLLRPGSPRSSTLMRLHARIDSDSATLTSEKQNQSPGGFVRVATGHTHHKHNQKRERRDFRSTRRMAN